MARPSAASLLLATLAGTGGGLLLVLLYPLIVPTPPAIDNNMIPISTSDEQPQPTDVSCASISKSPQLVTGGRPVEDVFNSDAPFNAHHHFDPEAVAAYDGHGHPATIATVRLFPTVASANSDKTTAENDQGGYCFPRSIEGHYNQSLAANNDDCRPVSLTTHARVPQSCDPTSSTGTAGSADATVDSATDAHTYRKAAPAPRIAKLVLKQNQFTVARTTRGLPATPASDAPPKENNSVGAQRLTPRAVPAASASSSCPASTTFAAVTLALSSTGQRRLPQSPPITLQSTAHRSASTCRRAAATFPRDAGNRSGIPDNYRPLVASGCSFMGDISCDSSSPASAEDSDGSGRLQDGWKTACGSNGALSDGLVRSVIYRRGVGSASCGCGNRATDELESAASRSSWHLVSEHGRHNRVVDLIDYQQTECGDETSSAAHLRTLATSDNARAKTGSWCVQKFQSEGDTESDMAQTGDSVYPGVDPNDLVHLSAGDDSAVVHMFGATVLSWKTGKEKTERLFMSKTAVFNNKQGIRGGIPFVFPNFGPWTLGPQHGFARTSMWSLHKKEGSHKAVFKLTETQRSFEMWPFRFELFYTVELVPDALQLRVDVQNTDTQNWDFTLLLHTYLKLDDIATTTIRGLDKVSYIDKVNAFKRVTQAGDIVITEATDRIYGSTGDVEVSEASGARILVEKNGLPDTVVWNPWKEGAAAMADLDDDAWKNMVCVEAGKVVDKVVLQPGEIYIAKSALKLLKSSS